MEPSPSNNHVTVKLHHVTANVREFEVRKSQRFESIYENTSISELFNVESMGICCSPKCGQCSWGKLSDEHKNMTIQEERENTMIADGLMYNEETPFVDTQNIKSESDTADEQLYEDATEATNDQGEQEEVNTNIISK